MTEPTDPTSPGWASNDPQQYPPPPPPPTPPSGPPPGSFDAQATQVFDLDSTAGAPGGPRPSRKAGRFAALGVGVLLLGGGTVFALTSMNDSGPATPEEAVNELFDAISNEDAIGVLGALDPAERDAIKDPVKQMADELKRLEVFDDSFDLGAVKGFDFEFENVELEVEEIREDLAQVNVVAGTAKVEVDGEAIPFGDFTKNAVEEFDGDLDELSVDESDEIDAEDSDGFVVAHKTSEGWRVSLGYSIAESAREFEGGSVPAVGDGITPVGSESPVEAVEQSIRSAAELDFEDVIARMSSEMRPLQEYADLYSDSLKEAEQAGTGEVQFTINSIDLSAEESGKVALVKIDGFDVSIDDGYAAFDVVVADGCATIDGDIEELGLEGSPFESGKVCTDDFDDLASGGFGDLEDGFSELGFDIPGFPPFNSVDVGMIAVREDGGWFVSPVRSGLDLSLKGLQSLNREHLDGMLDLVTGFTNSIFTEFDEFDDFDVEYPEVDDVYPEDDHLEDDYEDDYDYPDDFEGALTVEELFNTVYPDDADCLLGEFEQLDTVVQDDIRAVIERFDQGSPEGDRALADIFDTCGVE